jgi:hypothetical protein
LRPSAWTLFGSELEPNRFKRLDVPLSEVKTSG